MPYIIESRRFALSKGGTPQTPGELNYLITKIVSDYVLDHKISYTTYNEVMGVLECAKFEMYRRAVSKYEDKKIIENGDMPFYRDVDV